jgi:hypothetical protein
MFLMARRKESFKQGLINVFMVNRVLSGKFCEYELVILLFARGATPAPYPYASYTHAPYTQTSKNKQDGSHYIEPAGYTSLWGTR